MRKHVRVCSVGEGGGLFSMLFLGGIVICVCCAVWTDRRRSMRIGRDMDFGVLLLVGAWGFRCVCVCVGVRGHNASR